VTSPYEQPSSRDPGRPEWEEKEVGWDHCWGILVQAWEIRVEIVSPDGKFGDPSYRDLRGVDDRVPS